MYILFKSVHIFGFRSIEDEIIELDGKGIVKVVGKNNLETKTVSNGSGKSSIFESITWALYGKTSKGVTNPVNKFLESGCYVTVYFSIDNVDYSATRSVSHKTYGTGLILKRIDSDEETDLSGRNKTDTEKILYDLIKIDIDIFLSVIFLSQGYNNKISNLGPSARKNRIENITRTSSKIDEFKNSLGSKKTILSEKERELALDTSKISGKIDQLDLSINSLSNKINSHSNDKQFDENEISSIRSKKIALTENINSLSERLFSIKNEKSKLASENNSFNYQISMNTKKIGELDSNITSIKNNVCPVCNQGLKSDNSDKLLKKNEEELNNLNSLNESLKIKISDNNSAIDVLSNKISSIEDKLRDLKQVSSKYQSVLDEYSESNSFDIKSSREELESLKASKLDSITEKTNIETEHNDISEKIGILNNCTSIITKQFRDHKINQVIEFMNMRLKEYSIMLFSEDIISINDKLSIYLGDVEYESLSGGEERKADLALSLAQRDLALNVSGIVSNIFILDEVLDNLDEKATLSALDMISSVSTEISSLFIVSHNSYEIAYDTSIYAEKSKDGLTNITTFN